MQEMVERMAATLQHRGPNDSGVWIDGKSGIALGHRRLAVVDLSPTGRQPMRSSSGRYHITFNGEIYNFLKLTNELRRMGHEFRGHSDTEVLLAAIEAWGLGTAVQRFVGMFAFAVWDQEKRMLHLLRDRLGEKPLYYAWLNETFVFASELKALRSFPDWMPDIDRDALTLHMRHGYIPAPYSIYSGVYKLPPGSMLSINVEAQRRQTGFSPHTGVATDSQLCPTSYWSMHAAARRGVSDPINSESQATDELDRLLHQAIRDQMTADVPLGAFLSGGIDSSTVVSVMQSESSRPIKTFTIGFPEPDYDEAGYARKIAAHLGTEHSELYVTPQEALQVVPDLATIYDEPFSDASQIPTCLVSKLARAHVTVCLSGDGGDELFAGYNRYLRTESIWSKTRLMPNWLRKSVATAITMVSPNQWDFVASMMDKVVPTSRRWPPDIGFKLQKLARIMNEQSLVDMYRILVSYWDDPESLVLRGNEPPMAVCAGDKGDVCTDFIHQAMYWDLMSYLPDDNLAKIDRASMAVSLETRLPLLDHRLVEFAWRVPLDMKVRATQGKWLLRQVLNKYVPMELIDRPKMGFSVPIGQWLRGPLRDWAEGLLNERRLRQEGFFNAQLVKDRWREHLSGKRNWQLALWGILMFQAWHESAQLYRDIPDENFQHFLTGNLS